MAITTAKLNNEQYRAIASSYYLLHPINLNSSEMINSLDIVYNNKLTIIIISEMVNKIEITKLGDSIYSNYTIYKIPPREFYVQSFINKTLLNNKINQTILMFENKDYRTVVDNLALFNIIISGGSNTKKHLLSPVQLRLARFIIAISNFTGSDVAESFHFESESLKKGIDLTSTEAKLMISQVTDDMRNDIIHNPNDNNKNTNKSLDINTNKMLKNDSTNPIKFYSKKKMNIGQRSAWVSRADTYAKRDIHTSTIFKQDINYISNISKIQSNPINYYLNYIEEVINNSQLNPVEAQSKIENIWIDLIENKLQDDKYLLNTHGSKLHSLIFEAHKTLEILYNKKVINRKFSSISAISDLNKIEFILLTFVWCISYSDRLSYTSICRLIGENILFNMFVKSIFNNYQEYKDEIKYKNDLPIKLGDFFINLLTQFPHDLFERKFNPSSFYTRESVTLNINHLYLDDIRNNIIVNPYTLPMLCRPNIWNDNSYGGYLENKIREVSIITGTSIHGHKIENKDSLFKAVNYLNSIKFGVNNLLLDYLMNEGRYILDHIEADNDLQRNITLEIAKLFSQVPFYLNVHADWRGRIYTQSFFISYQGGDLSSALINLWDGQILTDSGKYHLYIHGANNHNENNISKESFDNRVEWVKNNYERIINLDRSLILSAEKPFAFTAFCLNMRELDRNPQSIVRTPVFLDATCSGIQHLSALLLDLELGITVNLSPYNQEDKPNDIYSELLIHINKAINKFGDDDNEYEKFSLIKLNRSDIKTSVMTKVYNVSKYGMAKQLENKFKSTDYSDLDDISKELIKSLKKNKLNRNNNNDTYFRAPGIDNKPVFLSRKDIFIIANIINDQIFVVYPSLNNIYSYFLEISKLMIRLGTPITWITPTGIRITQHYLKSKQSVISTKLFNKTKKMVIKEYLNETDKLKQSNAIIPNIVHSLDATHLMNVINTNFDEKYDPIITVHDCFGTHPNNMEQLVYRVKKEFIILYSQQNFLQTFHNRIIQSIRDNNFEVLFNSEEQQNYVVLNEELLKIPNTPQLGELDLQKIIESKYMIT